MTRQLDQTRPAILHSFVGEKRLLFLPARAFVAVIDLLTHVHSITKLGMKFEREEHVDSFITVLPPIQLFYHPFSHT